MGHVFRVHPTIGFARVGNSKEYNLAPESMAALPLRHGGADTKQNPGTVGGLPLRTDGVTMITNRDIRDADGKLRRQAARFKIFAYPASAEGERPAYPSGQGVEITIGSEIDGNKVKDIRWMVHVANKKANCYQLEATETNATSLISQYEDGRLPPLRNIEIGAWADDPQRVKLLTIDPGPRTIAGDFHGVVELDKASTATYLDGAEVKAIKDYPKHFPADSFDKLYEPEGPIDSLGQLRTDELGRLHVIAAYGRSAAWYEAGTDTYYPLDNSVDNDGWFDDTADGPVNAVIVFEDGSTAEVAGAWVVSTDPGYAPQTLNSVSLWEDIYDTWVRELELEPSLYSEGRFNPDYQPDFGQQLLPFFRSAQVQRWNTNLPELAIRAHDAVGNISQDQDPSETILSGLGYIRNPNKLEESMVGPPLMPLSLGDSGQALLSASMTQYFFLEQWDAGKFNAANDDLLGPGEYLDKASLINCLGGRFSPGIDMTFIVRQPELWETRRSAADFGPFRIREQRLDYAKMPPEELPFLSEGYVPCHSGPRGLQPGDTSKFMSVPWHTDYNSCATHEPSPNPLGNTTLYWSWPAQRPVAVNVAKDTLYVAPSEPGGEASARLPGQRWSLRGPGTTSDNYGDVGRYNPDIEPIVTNWSKVGTIIQRTQIEGLPNQDAIDGLPELSLLEVESLLGADTGPFITTWPTNDSGDGS